jgi:DNA uptake protein ComE-like DNA-binding protein
VNCSRISLDEPGIYKQGKNKEMIHMRYLKQMMVFSAVTALGLSACSSSEKRTEAQQNVLGQAQATQGKVDVQTQRQVVITERSEIPTVRTVEVKADLNRMQPKHFVALGFAPDLARKIVEYRKDHDGFKSVEELRQVEGMDEASFMRIRDKVAAARTG